ncbi:MAG: aspartyl/asparaginyl beta-hydroxylase domain-containing protein, partial [Kangiellaceae bacterium]|nr:aspartyl/asparaginyl beta-hydroxylase domain-containing protein [Kangiellaceae bacterium]
SHLLTVLNCQNIDSLTARLQLEKNWVPHVNKSAYLGEWDVIPLRCISEHQFSHSILQCFTHHSATSKEDWKDLPLMNQYSEIKEILDKLLCPIKSVRFMRLRAGAKILPHRDKGVCLKYGEARLHVPITSTPQVNFFVSKNKVLMNPGELWYIDANQQHSVENNSTTDRIHLVIDCISNNWLIEQVTNKQHG